MKQIIYRYGTLIIASICFILVSLGIIGPDNYFTAVITTSGIILVIMILDLIFKNVKHDDNNNI
jgi:hypothetical protein